MTEELRAGLYRHYKGPLYMVLGLAHDANADDLYSPQPGLSTEPLGEREVVVYVGLQLDEAHTGARLAVRTLEDFFASVCGSVGCLRYGEVYTTPSPELRCSNLHPVPRFEYVGMRYEG